MIKRIQTWLDNPKRDYHEGLQLFDQFASPSAQAQFGSFFHGVEKDEKVDQFDSRFSILINQISFVKLRLQRNSEAFKQSVNATPMVDITGYGNGTDTKTGTLPEGPVTLENLPKQFDKQRARLKELFPLMAKLHAEMAVETITPEARKKLVDELVKLDSERRSIWDQIENYVAGEGKEIAPEENENDYSENELVRGAQMAARAERLRENVKRNEQAIVKHQKANKPHLIVTAQQRIDKYSKELAELETLLKTNDQ